MGKNITIAVLAVCLLWLSAAVVRLENFHYGSTLGMCPEFKADNPVENTERHACLHAKETRTSPLWHLFSALAGE